MRIGLLGGSFNPAHDAHRQLSLYALNTLKLDAVWWLVSPQNPLKPTEDMADFALRFKYAQQLVDHPRLVVSDLETQLGTRYTIDTLKALQHAFHQTRFTWLMGTDNLQQFPKWQNWRQIARLMPIAVFPRPPAQLRAFSGLSAKYLAQQHNLRIIMMPLNPLSATQLRHDQNKI